MFSLGPVIIGGVFASELRPEAARFRSVLLYNATRTPLLW